MKDKIKTLPSSYREKKRYITFKIITEGFIETKELAKTLWKSAINNMGVVNVAKTNFHFFKNLYDPVEKKFIVRCLPKDVEAVRLSFALIKEIDGKPVTIVSIGVSGTMRSSKKKHLKQLTLGTYKV